MSEQNKEPLAHFTRYNTQWESLLLTISYPNNFSLSSTAADTWDSEYAYLRLQIPAPLDSGHGQVTKLKPTRCKQKYM